MFYNQYILGIVLKLKNMRIEIPIILSKDDANHWLSVEVQDDVIVAYLDNEELFKTDLDNLEELMTAIGLIWLDWKRTEEGNS